MIQTFYSARFCCLLRGGSTCRADLKQPAARSDLGRLNDPTHRILELILGLTLSSGVKGLCVYARDVFFEEHAPSTCFIGDRYQSSLSQPRVLRGFSVQVLVYAAQYRTQGYQYEYSTTFFPSRTHRPSIERSRTIERTCRSCMLGLRALYTPTPPDANLLLLRAHILPQLRLSLNRLFIRLSLGHRTEMYCGSLRAAVAMSSH